MNAYQKLELNEESKEHLTINTYMGLFEQTSLQFGVHSAAGILKTCMKQRMPYSSHSCKSAILVSEREDLEHLRNLEEVIKVLSEWDCGCRNKRASSCPRSGNHGYKGNKQRISLCN